MTRLLDEHFEYFTLPGRTAKFDAAIGRVVKPGDVVADLGCGFGILGLLCLKAGAARVYGIDHSDAILIASEAMQRAGLADRYTCIADTTFRTELPEPVDVLICDHVGYFGFDYGIVAMIADARRRLLKPGGRVMPRRLRLVMAGVASSRCRNLVDGWTQESVPSEYHWLRDYGINASHRVLYAPDDLCTAPCILGEIDLGADIGDSFSFDCRLVAATDCMVDGLAGWFECDLGGDESMTNSPLSNESIGRNQVFLPCENPFAARAGDEITVSLRVRHEEAMMTWTITPPRGAKRQTLSTFKSTVIAPSGLRAGGTAPPVLDQAGAARKLVLDLIDGKRDSAKIEDEIVRAHPALFPSEAEIRRFVRQELARNTAC